MATPRSVRIPHARPMPAVRPGAEPSNRFIANAAGSARAARLFLLFLILLVVMYAAFVALALSRPGASPAADPLAWGLFTAIAIAFGVTGWSITLGRAPQGYWRRPEELAVKERLGRVRRFPTPVAPRVARRFNPGPFGPEATVFVELTERSGARRTYLFGEGEIEGSAA